MMQVETLRKVCGVLTTYGLEHKYIESDYDIIYFPVDEDDNINLRMELINLGLSYAEEFSCFIGYT